MAYTTEAKVRLKLPSFPTGSTALGVPYSEIIEEAIAEAGATVDSKLVGRYGSLVPFADPVPPLVVQIATKLAAAEALSAVYREQGDPRSGPLAQAREWRKESMKQLEELSGEAAGQALLGEAALPGRAQGLGILSTSFGSGGSTLASGTWLRGERDVL